MNPMLPVRFRGSWDVSQRVADRDDIVAGFETLPTEGKTFAQQIEDETLIPPDMHIQYDSLGHDFVEITLKKGNKIIDFDSLNRPLSIKNWFFGADGGNGKPFQEPFQSLGEFLPHVVKKAKEMADKHRPAQ